MKSREAAAEPFTRNIWQVKLKLERHRATRHNIFCIHYVSNVQIQRFEAETPAATPSLGLHANSRSDSVSPFIPSRQNSAASFLSPVSVFNPVL